MSSDDIDEPPSTDADSFKHKPLYHRGPSDRTSLADHLCRVLGFGTGKVCELLDFGSVYVDSTRATSGSQVVGPDTLVKVYLQPKRFPMDKLDREELLLDNRDLLVVNKPSGVPCVPVASNKLENCLNFFEAEFGGPLYPLHRLDEGTSGILLFGKSAKVAAQFHKDHQQGKINKIYTCLTDRPIEAGLWTHYLKKGKGRMLCSDQKIPDSAQVVLEVQTCEREGSNFRNQIRLITGKTHQIRCQLAFVGAPILGDSLYGSTQQRERLMLHAKELSWGSIHLVAQGI